MPDRELHHRFVWHLEASPEALWPYVARTNQSYCLGGPQVTPHVVVQQRLAPGERRTVELALEPGSHRVRAGGIEGTSRLAVAADGGSEGTLVAAAGGVGPRNGLVLATRAASTLANETAEDPEVDARLAAGDVRSEPLEAALKGFADVPFELWRVSCG